MNDKCCDVYLEIMHHTEVLTFYHKMTTFNDPGKETFENIVGKGENAGNQHFLLFQR